MDKKNLTFDFEGGALMQARYNEIIAAKTYFFNLKDIYPKVSTQIIAFTKADKEEKAKLLPTIRQQVETWLNSFGSLLDTDKTFLSAKNEQILKIATQLKITAAKTMPILPAEYEIKVTLFLSELEKLNQPNLIKLAATAQEVEQLNKLISLGEELQTIYLLPFQLKGTNEVQIQNLKTHFDTKIAKQLATLKKLNEFNQNTPLNKAGKEKEKQFYSNVQDAASNRLIELEKEARKAGKNSPQAQQYEHLKKYQADLLDFAQNQSFTYKEFSKDKNLVEYNAQGDRIATEEGLAGFDFQANEATISINIHPSFSTTQQNRTAAHELQHLIQYKKGQLAFVKGGVWRAVYDIYDEVEAYQTEYIMYGDVITENTDGLYAYSGNKAGDAWANVSDPDSVKKFGENYTDLPNVKLGFNTKMSDFVQLFGQELFQSRVLEPIRQNWEYKKVKEADIPFVLIPEHQSLSLREFIDLVKKYHKEDYEKFVQRVKFK